MSNSLFDLGGRLAVVTGAASGLGRAIAIGLAAHGADIVGADIDDAGLAETIGQVQALGRRGLAVHCDTSQAGDVSHLFAEIDLAFDRVDILVNNAGIGSHARPEDLSLAAWERVMAVDITGYFLCAQAAGRRMIARQSGGSIINISSIAGSSALGRGNFVYSVAKGAVNQFTRELAVEWAKHKIRVNAIQPCQIRTPALQNLIDDPQFDSDRLVNRFLTGIPMNRLGEPADLVGPAVFLASDAAAWVTGVLLPVDGGNLALNAGGSHTW
jgi:NAD(P)-dependent dehydrogenase (short-subunit alcohol dehydrogenase family)